MTQTNDKPQLDSKYVKEIDGRQFVLYAGLLDLADRMNLKKLEVEVLQYANETNNHTVIVKAVAELENGKTSSDIGEASAETLPDPQVAKFIYSMSSTRAKSRCLRNLCGVGITALEECASIDDIKGEESAKSATEPTTKSTPKAKGSSTPKLVTVAQLKCLRSMATRKKWTEDELNQHCREKYSVEPEKLLRSDASLLIQHFKEAA